VVLDHSISGSNVNRTELTIKRRKQSLPVYRNEKAYATEPVFPSIQQSDAENFVI